MSGSNTARRLRRAGRGAVGIITILLISSAMLRLVSGIAMAEDDPLVAKPLPTAVRAIEERGPVKPTSPTRGEDASRTEMDSLLRALQEREAKVAERERQMELRGKTLEVANEEITRRLAALEQAEADLRETLSLADGAAEDDIVRLVAVYENMKPKDAARLFETMEPDFAAGFLGRMRPDAAAAILAGLTPEAAYSISAILAGRNARVPKT